MKNKMKCVITKAALAICSILVGTTRAGLELRVPPVVGSEAYSVYMDDQSERFKDYAPLFVGEHMDWMDVLYDTMSDWTVLT